MKVMWLESAVDTEHGEQQYKLWVPGGYDGRRPLPLVMMLHGCTQNPDDFAVGTRMNTLADQHSFLVLYPAQPPANNALRCWNWFLPEHQSRGRGEPAKLAAALTEVSAQYRVDAQRIFVAGISAGAAMAIVMGATYPDLFAAIGAHSGLEFKAGENLDSAAAAQHRGGPDPRQQGLAALRAMGEYRRKLRVIVFQGMDDTVVRPVNADQVIAQWAWTNSAIDESAPLLTPSQTLSGVSPGGYRYTQEVYADGQGHVWMEKWLVEGLKHAWSSGSPQGSYTDAQGPDASEAIWRFFAAAP